MEAGADSVALDPVNGAAGGRMRLTALAAAGSDAAALVAAAARAAALPLPDFSAARLEDEDWVRRSQAQFGPIRVSEKVWIVPSWHEPPDPHALVVRLDPGLAFGTGSHASTRLVLRALEKTIKRRRPRAGLRLRLGYIGHRRRQARRRRHCRGGHRSAGARYDKRECAHQRRKPARRAAGTAARGNLRHGPGQYPCGSPDCARSAARGAHASGRPHPAVGNPANRRPPTSPRPTRATSRPRSRRPKKAGHWWKAGGDEPHDPMPQLRHRVPRAAGTAFRARRQGALRQMRPRVRRRQCAGRRERGGGRARACAGK